MHGTRVIQMVTVAAGLAWVMPLQAEEQLPIHVAPTYQRIDLRLDPDADTYTGHVSIALRIDQPVDGFTLHAENMTINWAVLSTDDQTVDIGWEQPDSITLRVQPAAPLPPGDYRLDIDFEDDYDRQANGLYKVEEGERGYLFTQMEADEAREAFPCFDQPAFKFPYQFVLTVPEEQMAITNTPIESETADSGWRTVTFATSPPMPSYLLAIAVGPFETVDVPSMPVPTRIVTTRGKSHRATLAQEITPPILAALEEYFGQSYPYAKLDMIAVPEFNWGAMENPGAITYTESLLLPDPRTLSVAQRRRQAAVTAHELAHMWFGDLVTMAWWDDLWLNESFAEWMGDKITNEVFPEYGMDVSQVQSMQRTMASDARPSALPVRQPIRSVSDLAANVGAMYAKGQAVLGMYEVYLGEETFRSGIRHYLDTHAWGNATADDLWEALSEVSDEEVGASLATFIVQPGVPLVRVTLVGADSIRLSQERLANYGVDALPFDPWHIPVRLRYRRGGEVHTQAVMLTELEATVHLEGTGDPEWIMPHGDARGYYHWLMPGEMMVVAAQHASVDMTPRERVGFLGNLTALLDAGEITGDRYLDAINRFSVDPHPQVTSAVISALANVEGAFVQKESEDDFAVYVRRTLGPAIDRIGIVAQEGEAETASLLRPRLIGWLADEGHDPEIRQYAETIFEGFMADPASVDPGLIGVSIPLACMYGDNELYLECHRRFEASEANTERGRYLRAMASFRDRRIQEENLRYVLEGPLRPQEFYTIPGSIAGVDEEHQDWVFEWLMEEYDAVVAVIPPQFKAYLPFFAGGCSRERFEVARVFFSQPEHSAPGLDLRLARLEDSVNDCATLREREGEDVVRYLREFASTAQ